MKRFVSVCCGFLCVSLAHAQTNAVRTLSLDDAIQLAIQHNFQVQIDRLTPQISKFNLDTEKGAFDPAFNASVRKAHDDTGGGFDPITGNEVGTARTDTETYNAGISGLAPWGLQYGLNNSLVRGSGSHLDSNGFRVSDYRGEYNTFSGITLTQPLLRDFWIDKPRWKISLAKQQVKYDELGFRSTLIDIISQTEQAYYELIFDFENIKVQQAALELAQRLVAENKRRVQVGSMAPLDEKQAESQAAASQASLIAAYGTLDNQQNVIKNLITDNYGSWHDVEITPSQKLVAIPERFDIHDSWEQGIAINPELLRAKEMLKQNQITAKYQYNQVFPQLDLTGSYGRSGVGNSINPALRDIRDERLPSYTVGGILSIPLSNRSARNAYKASKAGVQQQLLAVKQVEQNVLVRIDDAIKAANTAFQQVQATRSAREYAELALEAEQKKLQVGKSTSFDVLGLQSKLTDARSSEIRAVADYNIDLSKIAQSIGSTLEKFHITVKIY